MVKRLCISVSDEDAEFLDVMQLSASGLFKQRVQQVREDSANYQNKLKNLEHAREILQAEVLRLSDELEKYKN